MTVLLTRPRTTVHRVVAMAASFLLLCAAVPVGAAVAFADHLNQLAAEASQRGFASVTVTLERLQLDDLTASDGVARQRLAERTRLLLAELGATALPQGRWDNQLGQIGLQVSAEGLNILHASAHAVAFEPGDDWRLRSRLYTADGSLDAIEGALDKHGAVEAIATLDIEGLSFDVDDTGRVQYMRLQPLLAAQLAKRMDAAQHLAADVRSSLRNALETGAIEATLRLDRVRLLALLDSGVVRYLRPVGFQDERPLQVDPEAVSEAARNGSAEVIVTLRNPLARDKLSPASHAAQKAFHERTAAAVLTRAGVRGAHRTLSNLGLLSVRVTDTELRALSTGNDRRVLAIELNKPMATTAGLDLAMTTINMPSAWTAGYRAAGQNLVVMDSGVQSNHLFLRGATGVSRVTYEACFGTSATSNNVTYVSRCPSPNANGDSPLGQAGSAAPVPNCSSSNPNACHHGTHVAGIAAGRNYAGIPNGSANMQGGAPDAGIIATQVFSYDVNGVAQPVAFTLDLVTAMEAVVSAMQAGTTSNPFSVNLSLGGGAHTSACGTTSTSFTTAAQTLYGLGVPVVAATGNSSSNTAIGWPACVPRVIKAAAVRNDGIATARATFSNVANPASFPNDDFFFAPGGRDTVDGTAIRSAISSSTSNAQYGTMSGTSQAAPQVTAVLAAVKAAVPGISVADAAAWMRNSGSVPITVNGWHFRRLQIPAF